MRLIKVLPGILTAALGLSVADCAGAGGALPTAPSATGGTTTLLENAPFSGHDSGTFEFLEAGCAAGFSPLRTHTAGTGTLVGAYSFETQECFDNDTLSFSGSFTITAANGDTLVGSLVGHATAIVDDVIAVYEFTATITGGTGRFAGATGTFSGTGQGNLATFAESRTFSGTVSAASRGHS